LQVRAKITAVHSYVPEYILTNDELATMVDTNDEWITSRTGIKERRILKGNHGLSFMGIEAVNGLLKKNNTNPEEIDLLICATVTGDYNFPATANIISDKCGLKNAFGYDVNAACSGFMYALDTASHMIACGKYKKIIVVGGDKMSSIINYQDRTTCIIFGDGCGAVLLEPSTDGTGIIDSILRSDGSGCKHLYQPAGGSVLPASIETVQQNKHFAYQEGQYVFKFAVTNMANVGAEIMEKNNLTAEDVDWLVPHQANKRIIDATRERMGLAEEKVTINIHKYGNTTNGTLPICLHEWENKFKKGDDIILAAFGGGFTWGAIYLKWGY
jgi:3-oxoacyl-[acyl-carrier-protein] synthase-3